MKLEIDAPFILLGPHRSGTTWLGEAFAHSSRVAYWPEPRQVWEYGNWFRSDDILTAADARPNVIRHIHRRFNQCARRHQADTFCEKTPVNCLRIPFLQTVYPQARFILIIRDGRSVLASTEIEKTGGPKWSRILKRLSETTPSEYPAFLQKLPWLMRKLTGRPLDYWGPRPEGWQQWLNTDEPRLVVNARQWAGTASKVWHDFHLLPHASRTLIRYEELVASPRTALAPVLETMNFPDPEPVLQFLEQTANPDGAQRWRERLNENELSLIRPHMESTLELLGYSW